MLVERVHRSGAQVRDRADVEHHAPIGDLSDEAVVFDRAHSVPDAVRPERLERAAHRGRPRSFARVRHRREPELAREVKCRLVRLRRIVGLEPAEPDPEHAAVAVLGCVAHGRLRILERVAADDVGRQPHLHAVQLPRLLRAVAVAGEDLVPVDTAPDTLGRREDPLDVDRAVRGGLRCVFNDDLAEVLRRSKRVCGQHPDLDEVREVAEVVQRCESFLRIGREVVVVPAGDLQQGPRPHRPLQVDVQLDLRVAHSRQRGSR